MLNIEAPAEADRVFKSAFRKRDGAVGNPGNLLGTTFRDARRPVRHALDDQLFEIDVTIDPARRRHGGPFSLRRPLSTWNGGLGSTRQRLPVLRAW